MAKTREMSAVSLDKYFTALLNNHSAFISRNKQSLEMMALRSFDKLLCFVRQIQREVKVLHLEE
jgi:hypothetical protein